MEFTDHTLDEKKLDIIIKRYGEIKFKKSGNKLEAGWGDVIGGLTVLATGYVSSRSPVSIKSDKSNTKSNIKSNVKSNVKQTTNGKGTTVNPNEIRFSQSSVNGAKEITESMKAKGWVGDPIDVVKMPDGKFTTVDNTRVLAARKAMGESLQQRIRMAFEVRELGVKSIPINILSPLKGTPLENAQKLAPEEVLKTFAIFRFIIPEASIRYAGGRGSLENFQRIGLKAGIDGVMVGNYLTTTGNEINKDLKMIEELEREI